MSEMKVFTGYISNAEALRKELNIAADDAMIAKKAYDKWGLSFTEHIFGMFAFAIYDEKTDEIICVRDRFGSESLYYYITEDNRLLYDTSIREMFKKEGFKKEFNHEALELYLSFSYLPGENTFFCGLKKLMPGRIMIFKDGKAEIRTYWEAKVTPDNSKTMEEYADLINAKLEEAIPDWKRGAKECGKPLGSFLSGGVDSGYLAALTGAEVTFSGSYEDPAFDESPYAAETARAIGTKNHRFVITPEMYFEAVPKAMYGMEEPLGDASCVVFYMCACEAAKTSQICYSGEGADELFCGYHAYVRRFKQLRDETQTDIPPVESYYIGNTRLYHEDEKKKILKVYEGKTLPLELARSLYHTTDDMDDMDKIMLCDLNVWFEGDIMLNAEKMSKAAGLDVRTPFLDQRVVDVALRVPAKYRINAEQTKLTFRKAAEHHLPKEIAQRKKIGFAAPTRTWITLPEYNAKIREKFESETAGKFFNQDLIIEMLNEDRILDDWRKIWCIYVFLIWYDLMF